MGDDQYLNVFTPNSKVSSSRGGRRLMCFFDGTSNRAAGPEDVVPTNVFRLNQAFTFGFSGIPQITFYFSGVGTRGDTMSMATGKGFDQIVTEAYINLASNYMDGDSIYLFGFSRGAAAARAISGMISNPGLLGADDLDVFPELWKYFINEKLGDGKRRVLKGKLKAKLLDPKPRVEFLGAFDTVAGTSWDLPRLFSKVRFHNLHLDECVKSAVQILSIDDNRDPSFRPLVWQAKADPGQFLEQIWMPGVHADVGGASNATFIGNVALLTMIDRIGKCCPELEWDNHYIRGITKEITSCEKIEITSERPGVLRKFLWFGHREIGSKGEQYKHPIYGMLAGEQPWIRGTKKSYTPKNLDVSLTDSPFTEDQINFLEAECSRALVS